jgi:hypothetical protein
VGRRGTAACIWWYGAACPHEDRVTPASSYIYYTDHLPLEPRRGRSFPYLLPGGGGGECAQGNADEASRAGCLAAGVSHA